MTKPNENLSLVKKSYPKKKRFSFTGALQVLGIPKLELKDRKGHVYTRQEIIDLCGGKQSVWEWAKHHHHRTMMLIHQRHFDDHPMHDDCIRHVNQAKMWLHSNLFEPPIDNLSWGTLKEARRLLGLPPKLKKTVPQKESQLPVDRDEILRLRYQGWLYKKLARYADCSEKTIWSRVKGFPMAKRYDGKELRELKKNHTYEEIKALTGASHMTIAKHTVHATR